MDFANGMSNLMRYGSEQIQQKKQEDWYQKNYFGWAVANVADFITPQNKYDVAMMFVGGGLKIVQKGARTITKATADVLNKAFGKSLHSREWGRALEQLKRANSLPNDFHGGITASGDYVDAAGNVIDNIGNYLP